jgi:hypothetical protein
MPNNNSDILSTLVQAFSALSIFVFYFGWVWQDAYLQMFGLRISAFEFPFYYFLVQGLKINFPFQIEGQTFTRWEFFAWVINFILISFTLIGNTSKRFKEFYSNHPLISVAGVTLSLAVLFVGVHYVGTNAGHERARAVLRSPGQLRPVIYEYLADAKTKPTRFYGYLLVLTKDTLYVVNSADLEAKVSAASHQSAASDLAIVPLDRLSYIRTAGYSAGN